MGRTYPTIERPLAEWVEQQPVFFVATSPLDPDGHVNLSPKGNRGEFVVLDDHTVAYLDQTGSGVETIAHLRENGRIALMWCAFTGPPRIVRMQGKGTVVVPYSDRWDSLAEAFASAGGSPDGPGVRAAIVVEVDRIADSCGYGVPFMDFIGHRPTMNEWSARKGVEGVAAYQAERNRTSIDGLPALG